MTPTHRLAAVLRAENDALAAGDMIRAADLLPEKQAAAAALRAVLPGFTPDPGLLATLRALAADNERRLALAIEVQGRVLEMVARAARKARPVSAYGAKGAAAANRAPGALVVRA